MDEQSFMALVFLIFIIAIILGVAGVVLEAIEQNLFAFIWASIATFLLIMWMRIHLSLVKRLHTTEKQFQDYIAEHKESK